MPGEIVTFGDEARQRIRAAVRSIEGGGPVQPLNGGGVRGVFGEFDVILGKADAAISKSASGTVSVYTGTTAGSETDTTNNITAYARWGDVASGKWVLCIWLLGHWEIIQAEC